MTQRVTSARPLFGLIFSSLNSSASFTKTESKKVVTAWPKMIGSEIFIIVAFK